MVLLNCFCCYISRSPSAVKLINYVRVVEDGGHVFSVIFLGLPVLAS